jgi:isoquinoline 1-oxidoreductase beta subunit
MTKTWRLTRRKFLIGLGTLTGGVAVGLPLGLPYLRRQAFQFLSQGGPPSGNIDGEFQLWFEFTDQNLLNINVAKVEMGQGAHTALGQLAAEELEVPWENVRVFQAGTLLGPTDSFGTGGSSSVSGLFIPLRQLAANYRFMLTQAAEEHLNNTVTLNKGVFVDPGGNEITLSAASRLEREWVAPETDAPLKSINDFKLIGKSVPRVDIVSKLTAQPMYSYDMKSSNNTTYYGAVARPPVVGAQMQDVDANQAKSLERVISIVLQENFVGVVAEDRETAIDAIRAININWKLPRLIENDDIDLLLDPDSNNAIELKRVGDSSSALEDSNTISAEYSTPLAATAPLEPQSSLAELGDDGIMYVRTPTQFPNQTTSAVAEAIGFDEDKVDVTPTYLGGGFGRRQRAESAVEAAILAIESGLPVHIGWTRSDEFLFDRFRPPTKHKLRGILNTQGTIEALEHRQSSGDVLFSELPEIAGSIAGSDFGATRGIDSIYNIPNLKLYAHRAKLPIATSAWRGLGLLANTFANESFVDELAFHANQDPLQFRLDHLDGETGSLVRNALLHVAKMSKWKELQQSTKEGSGMGIACCIDYGTIVAQVVQVEINKDTISVPKVWSVMDSGLVVNPNGAKNQVEGNIIWGLGSALKEEITFNKGTPSAKNFGDYQLLRIDESPEIFVDLLPSDRPPQGVGEPAIGPIPAALANAIFAATGKRIRKLPLTI